MINADVLAFSEGGENDSCRTVRVIFETEASDQLLPQLAERKRAEISRWPKSLSVLGRVIGKEKTAKSPGYCSGH